MFKKKVDSHYFIFNKTFQEKNYVIKLLTSSCLWGDSTTWFSQNVHVHCTICTCCYANVAKHHLTIVIKTVNLCNFSQINLRLNGFGHILFMFTLFSVGWTCMWHDQGKWVTCWKFQFLFSYTIFSFLQNASSWCKPQYNWISGYRVMTNLSMLKSI